jgi:hypothetical protein
MPVTRELEDRDGGGGELFSHAVKHGRRRGISDHARDDRRSGGHQREREFWDRGIMANDQKRSGFWRCMADQVEKLRCRSLVHAVIEGNRGSHAEPGLSELPCLPGSPSGGAYDLVRCVVRSAQPVPHKRRIPLAAAGQRPIMVWHIRPGRLSVPHQQQRPVDAGSRIHRRRGLVARVIRLLSPCHDIAELLPVRKRGSRTHRPYGGLACPPRRARSGGIHHRAAYAAASTVRRVGRNVDTRNEQSTWPRDTVGGGGGARLIRGDTANGPCQARAGRTAACVAKVSEGEVLMARGTWGYVVRGRVRLSGDHEGRAGRVGGPR